MGTVMAWGLIAVGAGIALLGGMWLVVPNLYGLPWVPSQQGRIRRALALAGVQPGERVYDLGAGDGRALIVAAREFGAQAVGVEIEPLHCAAAWLRARAAGVGDRVSVRWGDLYKADVRDADVVFLFLTPSHVERIGAHLAPMLRPGARVVSVVADIPGWRPATLDRDDLIFLYRMPPQPGGLAAYLADEDSSA